MQELRDSAFSPQHDLPKELSAIRSEILAEHSSVAKATEVEQDRVVGLALYRALPPQRVSLRAAADDSAWRYLSLDVLPDLVLARAGEARDEWFWSSRWRIWLKRVWWLVHLAWQGDVASTKLALRRWTTDTIAQFVERPGRGFRVELWRGIAAESARRSFDEAHFRRVMKMNTALLTTFEPTLNAGSIKTYVENLFTATDL